MENNNKEQRILSSLDGLEKATAPDFFYTRLTGRMQREQPETKKQFELRPVLITVSLSVVLMLNIFALMQLHTPAEIKRSAPSVTSTGEGATIESFANAYNLNTESVYE